MRKESKAAVSYGPASNPLERCGVCEHYLGAYTCALVMGDIRPDYWCRLFEKRPKARVVPIRQGEAA